ncbi:MAG: FtsW/RodA/SpoVE family cell cycle protein [Clostridiales bacterium]|nr:FtsW/RodA/SpoVE family cell cycle protein [Clostridiales bacterium]MDD7261016.1 FtsW/RodA/SpoVE family cell cycle protein [Eubacteriales bacterium]
MQDLQTLLNLVQQSRETYAAVFLAVSRYLVPALGVWLLLHCARPLISFRREPEIWAWLKFTDGTRVAVTHWENVIGRAKSSDITVALSTVSRNHAVLTRYDDGSWTITDASSKTGTWVNGERVDIRAIGEGDVISIGGVDMELQPITKRQEQLQSQLRTGGSSGWSGLLGLLILTLLQAVMLIGFLLNGPEEEFKAYVLGFGAVAVCQWVLFFFYLAIRRRSFEVETLAFFLCTLGAAAIATVKPGELGKQSAAMVLGVLMFLLIGWSLRDLERAKRFRYLAVLAGVGFLVVTLLFGKEYYGAKNWLVIGNLSLQPSELSKVCFVYAGASTMDRIMNKRNLILFIAYSVVICGLLALMNDFGTALIFFCAFLIIAYLRSGSMGTIALACTALGFAGVLALRIAPHALSRFATWRHIWDDPYNSGYQQTQAIMCIASGGLFGLGPGNGYLQKVFAADSDIVFATISEEWGLLVAVQMVLAISTLGLFAIRTSRVSRSSFYCIGGCTAAGILLIQASLNCLGTVDILPFTGVTFPFLSNGGTSMIGAWGLLAFVKAADTRQNASFAVRFHK